MLRWICVSGVTVTISRQAISVSLLKTIFIGYMGYFVDSDLHIVYMIYTRINLKYLYYF